MQKPVLLLNSGVFHLFFAGSTSHDKRMKITLLLLALVIFGPGCASTGETTSYLREQSGGLPAFAAFVYEEEVHVVGAAFSTKPMFWEDAYPVAAESVQRADRFPSYDEALTSGADLIVLAKNRIYGDRDLYKTSLVVYVRDRNRKLLSETGFQGKQTTKKDEAATFQTLGQLIRDHIRSSVGVKSVIRSVQSK